MIPRIRAQRATCQLCLGSGETLDQQVPAWCETAADVIAWADVEGVQVVPCRACAGTGLAKAGAA